MFTTAICELESLIHIRSVTNISDDIHDFKCEIPNHNYTLSKWKKNINPRKPLEVTQAIIWRLWKHWIDEYLVNNKFSQKWNDHSINPKKGSILWLKCVNLPWWQWPLARTSTISPGRDNIVRIVELKTVCARSTKYGKCTSLKRQTTFITYLSFSGKGDCFY